MISFHCGIQALRKFKVNTLNERIKRLIPGLEIIGTEYIINYTKRENYFDRFAKQIGTAFFNSFGTAYRAQ